MLGQLASGMKEVTFIFYKLFACFVCSILHLVLKQIVDNCQFNITVANNKTKRGRGFKFLRYELRNYPIKIINVIKLL